MDNERTVDGSLMHHRAHDEKQIERRGDTLTARGLRVISHRLQIMGVCDVVEFSSRPRRVPSPGQTGLWQPYPVEYKRGAPKADDSDALQPADRRCAWKRCCCAIPEGSLLLWEKPDAASG